VPCDAKQETCTGPGANKESRLGNEDQAQPAPAEGTLNEENGTLNFIGYTLAKKHTRILQFAKDDKTDSLKTCSNFSYGVS